MKPNALEIALAILAVAILIWIANWDPFGSKARMRARTIGAESQAHVSDATAKAVDQVATKTQAVEARTHVVVRTIREAPGANSELPPGFRDKLCAGLGSLRDGPVCTEGELAGKP